MVINDRGLNEFSTEKIPCKPLAGYSSRPDQYLSLNDNRFEPINKSPRNLSNIRRPTHGSFCYSSPRQANLFGIMEPNPTYDFNKDKVMPSLTKGILSMGKGLSRDVPATTEAVFQPEVSCIDTKKVIEASTRSTKPREPTLTDISKRRPRDELLYVQDDRKVNIALENTKEERERQMQARQKSNRKYDSFFSSSASK